MSTIGTSRAKDVLGSFVETITAHPKATLIAIFAFVAGFVIGGAFSETASTTHAVAGDRISNWESPDGKKIRDYYRPGEFPPYRQRIEEADGSVAIGEYSKESGKRHGHWEFRPPLADEIAGKKKTENSWYWYGELIDEGTWHLRNK
jgi:hypothetical protein